MLTQISASSPAVPINLLNNKMVPTNECLEGLINGPELSTPSGMKEIKMVEIFSKWCPFVPVEYHDEICPEPPKDVIEKVLSIS
jgi:hypothetical protein